MLLILPDRSEISMVQKCQVNALDFDDSIERTGWPPIAELKIDCPELTWQELNSLTVQLDTQNTLEINDIGAGRSFLSNGYRFVPLDYGHTYSCEFLLVETRRRSVGFSAIGSKEVKHLPLYNSSAEVSYRQIRNQYNGGTQLSQKKGKAKSEAIEWQVEFLRFMPGEQEAQELDLVLSELRGCYGFRWWDEIGSPAAYLAKSPFPKGLGKTEAQQLWLCPEWQIDFISGAAAYDLCKFSGKFVLENREIIYVANYLTEIVPKSTSSGIGANEPILLDSRWLAAIFSKESSFFDGKWATSLFSKESSFFDGKWATGTAQMKVAISVWQPTTFYRL